MWRLHDIVDDDADPLVYLRGQWVRKRVVDHCIHDALLEAERQGILSRDPNRPGVWRSHIAVPKSTNGES